MTDETQKITKPEKTNVPEFAIDEDTATGEFERWTSAMRIKLDRKGIDENDRKDNDVDKLMVIEQIMEGKIEINENDLLVFHPETGNPLTFHRPQGGDLVCMDRKKKWADMGKINISMAAVTKTSEVTFSKMWSSDYQICQTIWSLFLV